jgi:formiminoglutamase
MKYYNAGNPEDWTGRVDSRDDPDFFRIHQIIETLDLKADIPAAGEEGTEIAILAFACDEGVRRNHGRPGAAEGPVVFRKAFADLPVPGKNRLRIIDAGTVSCPSGDLEEAQLSLAEAVAALKNKGYLPLVIGGGHETAYGHYSGLVKSGGEFPAILNWDAHLDMREAEVPTSGTPFRQAATLAAEKRMPFRYLCAGLRPEANTRGLREEAAALGVQWIFSDALNRQDREAETQLASFLEEDGPLYLTIDMDVFEASRAPGVSAPGVMGLVPERILPFLARAVSSGRLAGIDFTELNPSRDIDGRTASLAAALAWRILDSY